jgi:hypothetical protein
MKLGLFIFLAVLSVSLTWAARPAAAYWAIAYSQGSDGAWSLGTGWNAPSPAEAARKALSFCREEQAERGTNGVCTIVARGNGGCAAIAVKNGGNGWGVATGDLDQGYSAIAYCRSHNQGAACDLKSSFCDRNLGGHDPQEATINNNIPSPSNNAPSFSVPSFNAPSYSGRATTNRPAQRPAPMPAPSSYRTPINPCRGPGACATR